MYQGALKNLLPLGKAETRNEPNPISEHSESAPDELPPPRPPASAARRNARRNLMAGELANPDNEYRRCETNLIPKTDTSEGGR
jgi:hypothetical protein